MRPAHWLKLPPALAPSADDVWLYWMHRMAGVPAQKIGGHQRLIEWQGSQTSTLRAENYAGSASGNDRAVAALLARYGWPGGS